MKRRHPCSYLVPAIVIGVLLASPHRDARSEVFDSLVQAELISEVQSIQPGEPFWVAIRLIMHDGWHINWINPGDAGLPPTVEWSLPPGFEASDLHWPYPEKFSLPELSIFGYEGEVLLLAELTPPTTLKAPTRVALGARVNWLACREACVPGGADLRFELSVMDEVATPNRDWVEAFRKTRKALPTRDTRWEFRARVSDDRIVILATPPAGDSPELKRVSFFPSAQGLIENASDQRLRREGATYQLDVERSQTGAAIPSRIKGVLVSREGWGRVPYKALEIDIPVGD